MWIFWLLVLVAVVFVIKAVINPSGAATNNAETSAQDALDILKKRLANGEIDEEEFERKRKLLE